MLDYDKLYNSEFIAFKDCYKTCDSYCCSNFLGKTFKILSKNRVVLPLLEEEYLHYKSKGGIQNITQEKREIYTLKNGKQLILYFLYCECGGLCQPHAMRPLICRIYPYFPLVSLEGEILGFYPASLMDLFFGKKESHCCTLVREKDAETKEQLTQSLKALLESPLYIFAFRALEILTKTLQKHLNYACIDTLNPQERAGFLKQLEWSLLSNKAWDNAEFKDAITQEYEAVSKRYGDFL